MMSIVNSIPREKRKVHARVNPEFQNMPSKYCLPAELIREFPCYALQVTSTSYEYMYEVVRLVRSWFKMLRHEAHSKITPCSYL